LAGGGTQRAGRRAFPEHGGERVAQDLDRMSLRNLPLPEELVFVEIGVEQPPTRL
jgi:hypothetical protein